MLECYFTWCRWHEEQEYGPKNAEPFCTRQDCVASKENLVQWSKMRDSMLEKYSNRCPEKN